MSDILNICANYWVYPIEQAINDCTDINVEDSNGDTPLILVAKNSDKSIFAPRIIKLLLLAGANVNDKNGKALIEASRINASIQIHPPPRSSFADETVLLLIEYGAYYKSSLDQFNYLLIFQKEEYIRLKNDRTFICDLFKNELVNELEKKQYYIGPGRGVIEIIKDEFPEITDFDIFKSIKK